MSEIADAMRDIEAICPQIKVGFLYVRPDSKPNGRNDSVEVSLEDVESGDIILLKDYDNIFDAYATLQGIFYGLALAIDKGVS
ncbi:MAG: hypothetical protein J6W09_04450 [Bacteroidales bacterium]|nr:hypothetical protein [Bacteroidales bacterium]